jgi:pyruvate kinase
MSRKAKIVATLGPASDSEDILGKMVLAGMDVARFNFSHGTHEEHAQRLDRIRKISCKLKKPITILQDLQGPKLRVGVLPEKGVNLVPGSLVRMCSVSQLECTPSDLLTIPMDVPDLIHQLSIGSRILLDDGRLEVQVTSLQGDMIEAKVTLGGKLTSHKGVNLPGADLQIPAFTEKDREDLKFGLENNIDMLAISFVQTVHDIEMVKAAIEKIDPKKKDIPIIAKLERPKAITNLEAILQNVYGVMVARGDLGVETSPSEVPIIQKMIIEKANQQNKIVITATQMLESMINNPRPTRAEASDVANAIFDGTDAVMLSGETAAGNYPIETIKMMDQIVEVAEKNFDAWGHCETPSTAIIQDDAIAMVSATRALAHDRNVNAIAVFSLSGKTALLMSKARPEVPILTFTPNETTYHKLGIMWGVQPFLVPVAQSVEQMISIVESSILSFTELKKGQQIIIVTGLPVYAMRAPNFALLHTIGADYS